MTDNPSKYSIVSRYRLEYPSFLLIALPYFAFNWKEIFHSPFFSIPQLVIILLVIAVIDLFIKALLISRSRFTKAIVILLLTAAIVFFYGYYFVADLQQFAQRFGKLPIRMRMLFVLLFISLVSLQAILFNKRWFYKLLNVYLLIFSVLVIAWPRSRPRPAATLNSIVSHPVKLRAGKQTGKPLILLITDEYQSPPDMAALFGDSSLNNFSDSLSANHWIVKPRFVSRETSTLHSISSLLNFNLSTNADFSKQSIIDIGTQKLSNPTLLSSLQSKNVRFINFGIFNFSNSPALTPLYFYPTNFLQHVLVYTSYYVLKYNTGGFDINGFQEKYSPFEGHNKRILASLPDTLSSLPPKSFVYAHLMMPHQPFQYSPGFPLRITNTLEDYKDYWNFTNEKLSTLVQELTASGKYRVILTGDHGYRMNDSLNVRNTFSAFYGFDSSIVNGIESVQDLGSLIDQSF